MFFLDLVIIGLLAVAVVMWIGEPFFRRSPLGERFATADEQTSLILQKEVLYTALGDLTFDFHTGKVEVADYAALRQELEAEAIEVLQSLDAVTLSAALHDEIEQQVQRVRHLEAGKPLHQAEVVCADCRALLQGTENFCPACGQALKPS